MRAIFCVAVFTCLAALAPQEAKADVPSTPVPAGYGRYCSLSYPGGGWAFATLTGATSDPCGDMLRSSPGGTIERAGLWDTQGANNVLWNCKQGLGIYRAAGSAATAYAYNDAVNKKKTHCVFVVSPTALPVFGLPYGRTHMFQTNPSADVSTGDLFNYNTYQEAWDVTQFGQTPDPTDPTPLVNRYGQANKNTDEPANDWGMPAGKPILSVARGTVLAARARDVYTEFPGCGPEPQNEVYVEHKIGSGEYAERFVTYYAHLQRIDVMAGQNVERGTPLGTAGNTGCSGGNHLHFGVSRLTNLSGYRKHNFSVVSNGYGINGKRGLIDPFGWAAPQHIDPLAWKYLNNGKLYNDDYYGTIKIMNPGAFSIYLWDGAAPPIAQP